MAQRLRDGGTGGRGEQDEGEPGRQKPVERIGGVKAGEHCRRAGGGERLRHVGGGAGGRVFQSGLDQFVVALDPLGGNRQRDAEQHAEHHAHERRQQTVIDRQFDEECAAERDRGATEPDEPVLDQHLFPVSPRRRGGGLRRGRFGQSRLFGNGGWFFRYRWRFFRGGGFGQIGRRLGRDRASATGAASPGGVPNWSIRSVSRTMR